MSELKAAAAAVCDNQPVRIPLPLSGTAHGSMAKPEHYVWVRKAVARRPRESFLPR